MITLAIVLAILVLFALLRFGVSAEYSADGFAVAARVGPISVSLFPRKEKPGKAKKKAPKKPKKKKKAKEKPKKAQAGGLDALLAMIPPIKNALGRIKRRLLIKKLTVYYTSGGSDPAMTGLYSGAANATFGALAPILDNNFRVKRRDLRAQADFITGEQAVYVNAAISLAVWEAVYIALALLPILLGGLKKKKATTERKEDIEDGKAPDK